MSLDKNAIGGASEGDNEEQDRLHNEIEQALTAGIGPKIARFALAFIGGAIPLVGGAFSGAGGAWSEREQNRYNKLFAAWLKLQEDEIREIWLTLSEVLIRLDLDDPVIQERIESPQYLSLVKKAFRDWSAAESEEKRVLIRNLLANAAASRICTDDVIRMFIKWIDDYSETHFAVIKAIYNKDGITREGIWDTIYGEQVREDSAEADLFKLLVRDLSMGGVVRQHREKDAQGNFIKERPQRFRGYTSRVVTSAFDDSKGYELTELGKQFVHYTMNEIVPRIAASSSSVNEE